jgi:hypothetical protein
MQQGQDIGPVLLKLRFLASRLGSGLLEEWVKHETEGYPKDVEVPDYRKIGVAYTATFSGPYGSGIQNAPIPGYLIEKYAGKHWTHYEIRQSVAAVDDLASAAKDSDGSLQIDASNLILLLQGKVSKNFACNGVKGIVSKAALTELQNAVRTRILELTLELEKSIPASTEIALGPLTSTPPTKDSEAVTQITQQIIHGNQTNITASGKDAQFQINVLEGNSGSLMKALVEGGIAESDAAELAEIVASEKGGTKEEPFGTKARAWIIRNIGKAADGTWKAGVAVATKVLTEAALHYYGLK